MLAEKAGAVAGAEILRAELLPQLEEAKLEATRLREEATAAGPTGDAPRAPDLEAARARVAGTAKASREAEGVAALATSKVAAASASADRVVLLEQELRAADAEVADWQHLADDLGKDGLQAMEIDAVGPELSEQTNDLLRSCWGPRFTVGIHASRRSADGTQELEGCTVSILDNETGREGLVESLSGGEKVMVSEAIALALCVVSMRRAGAVRPTLVRDETGAALRGPRIAQYVLMLRRAGEILGADKILFVPNVEEAAALADARIVVADGKVSVQA